MQKMVECFVGKQLVTVIPEEAITAQRHYWERQGKGQDFWTRTQREQAETLKQAEALRPFLVKKIEPEIKEPLKARRKRGPNKKK